MFIEGSFRAVKDIPRGINGRGRQALGNATKEPKPKSQMKSLQRQTSRPIHLEVLLARCLVLFVAVAWTTLPAVTAVGGGSTSRSLSDTSDDDWRLYPVRSQDEAAVIEWGHSAIISALDAAVAHFGPQTTQAALLEVETKPILAEPVDGTWKTSHDEWVKEQRQKNPDSPNVPLKRLLDNADEIHGNVAVMTDVALTKNYTNSASSLNEENDSTLTGLDLALLAQASGAAALLIVHVDESRPDDMYRLDIPLGREAEAATIDIPVVVISLASATVLTSATVTDGMKTEDIVNNGMPDRIRLYAGGDRPFFEDVEALEPTVYIIHNLLTTLECNTLIQQATRKFAPVEKADALQLTVNAAPFVAVDRVMLWQGIMKGPGGKAIDERIEQVTGFPVLHYSDWIVDRIDASKKAHWKPHYDVLPGNEVPLATITVFLSDVIANGGGDVVFPSTNSDPIKIRPIKGLAIVHHNTNERHEFDEHSIHGLLPLTADSKDILYVARKYILPAPVSNARRVGLPIAAWPTGGKLPPVLVQLHDVLTAQFGAKSGGVYFDKLVVFVPVLLLLVILQFIGQTVHKQMKAAGVFDDAKKVSTATTTTTAATVPISKKSGKKKN